MEQFPPQPRLQEDDILIRNLLLVHDPDGREFDSELLFHAIENIIFHIASPEKLFNAKGKNDINRIEVDGSEDSLGYIICSITSEILIQYADEGNPHFKTMNILDFLGKYRWDAKLVLVLAAFAISYGEFWIAMQVYPHCPLAASVAKIKQLPQDLRVFKPQLKALNLLARKMLDVTRYIIKFATYPGAQLNLGKQLQESTKSQVYLAVYWMIRSSLMAFSHIKNLKDVKPHQQVQHGSYQAWSIDLATYAITSTGWLRDIIKKQVKLHAYINYEKNNSRGLIKIFQLRIFACDSVNMSVHIGFYSPHNTNPSKNAETKMVEKLKTLLQESQTDNQEILSMLFTWKLQCPLTHKSSQEKVGTIELKNKVLLLLVSKKEFLLPEELLVLLHLTYYSTYNKKLEESYEIIWVPIPTSSTWNNAEERSFNIISNYLPWHSIRQPHLLSTAVVNFMRQEWNYKDEPIMVVLNEKGAIMNSNALDMVKIWGARAYPFTPSTEVELWQGEHLALPLLFEGIDPEIHEQILEGNSICIYGTDDIAYFQELHSKVKEIVGAGMQLEFVYVGKRNCSTQVMEIAAIINEEDLQTSLSLTSIWFFWLRLESMRRSLMKLEKNANADHILAIVSALLDYDEKEKGWAVIGEGPLTDSLCLAGNGLTECLNLYPEWAKNVQKFGVLGAITAVLEPTSISEPCGHSEIIHYEKGLAEKLVLCSKCRHAMKTFIVYE